MTYWRYLDSELLLSFFRWLNCAFECASKKRTVWKNQCKIDCDSVPTDDTCGFFTLPLFVWENFHSVTIWTVICLNLMFTFDCCYGYLNSKCFHAINSNCFELEVDINWIREQLCFCWFRSLIPWCHSNSFRFIQV